MMAEKQIQRTAYTHADPYVTIDGSIVRELMHPDVHGNSYLSLAEARVPPGSSTILHIYMESQRKSIISSQALGL